MVAVPLFALLATACGVDPNPITQGTPDNPVLLVNSDTSALVGPDGVAVGIYSEIFDPTHGVEAADIWTGLAFGRRVADGQDWVRPTIGRDGAILYGVGGKVIALTASADRWWTTELGASTQTPVSIGTDGTLYFGDNSGFVHALTADGDPLWATWLGDVAPAGRIAIDPQGRLFLEVITDPSTLHGEVVALDANGVELWRSPNDVRNVSVVIDNDGNVLTANYLGDGSVERAQYALDQYRVRSRNPATGELNWETDPSGNANGIHVRPDGDLIVTVGTYSEGATPEENEGAILVLNPSNGNQKSAVEPGLGVVVGGVIADNGRFYFGCGAQVCEAALNGSLTDNQFFTQEYVVVGPPAVHQGMLVANGGGVVYSWELGGNVHTESRGWPRAGVDNGGRGQAR